MNDIIFVFFCIIRFYKFTHFTNFQQCSYVYVHTTTLFQYNFSNTLLNIFILQNYLFYYFSTYLYCFIKVHDIVICLFSLLIFNILDFKKLHNYPFYYFSSKLLWMIYYLYSWVLSCFTYLLILQIFKQCPYVYVYSLATALFHYFFL